MKNLIEYVNIGQVSIKNGEIHNELVQIGPMYFQTQVVETMLDIEGNSHMHSMYKTLQLKLLKCILTSDNYPVDETVTIEIDDSKGPDDYKLIVYVQETTNYRCKMVISTSRDAYVISDPLYSEAERFFKDIKDNFIEMQEAN